MATPNTHFGAEEIERLLAGVDSIFFIGIGGVNMSSLARMARKRGFRAGGSDRQPTEVTRALEEEGIRVFYEHAQSNLDGFGAVVYTVAIPGDNPEYMRAKREGLPLVSRADFLGYLMASYRRRVGVCGMHGKSTCTSMCAEIAMAGSLDPTVMCGAALSSMGGYYRIGQGARENFIFEACEYMDSFLDFYPTVAVVLNIEMDHVDYFHSMEQIRSSFRRFACKAAAQPEGCAVVNADDEEVRKTMEGFEGKVVTFSTKDPHADFYAGNVTLPHGRPSFDIFREGKLLCHADLGVTGLHNVYNALGAAAGTFLCGASGEDIAKGLAAFRGALRRTEYKGQFHGAEVYDDYGHHPTEVKTTLEGIRAMGCERLVCVFQPHTYSRTAGLFEAFSRAFDAADETIVADIYAAREQDTGVVSAEKLAAAIGERGKYVGDTDAILSYLGATLGAGDCLVIMGAGDIYKIFPKLGL